jgi:acetyl esterase/lipase
MTEVPVDQLFRPDAISPDTKAVNIRLAKTLAAVPLTTDLAAIRHTFAHGLAGIPASPKAAAARTLTIARPGGHVALRILVPDEVRGVYLHIHGGGWMVGTNDMWDDQLQRLGREAGLACVSVEYRLAPEHVFPAAVDDCMAAAAWLIDQAEAEFGTRWLAIGGESAGAHLAVATLLRLRATDQAWAFQAANLLYGCYDLSLTPSARQAQGTPVIDRSSIERFVDAFRGETDVRDPTLSPLYASLADMPAALFSVGTLDPLVDDSLFMHRRWQAAGNEAEIALYPGGVHGFNSLEGELAESANDRCSVFFRQRLTQR